MKRSIDFFFLSFPTLFYSATTPGHTTTVVVVSPCLSCQMWLGKIIVDTQRGRLSSWKSWGSFPLLSYFLFLKYWERTLVVSFISPEVGFYITDMCIEVVTVGSLYSQWRERGISTAWFISLWRRMNPAWKCPFLPTSQWGSLGLLAHTSFQFCLV